MPFDRFYSKESFAKGKKILIEDVEFHHLSHVMRIKEKDDVELVNGKGMLAKARVEKITRQHAGLSLQEVTFLPAPTLSLILALALPRMPRLEMIIEKGVELGVSEFWLFPGEYSERKELSPSQLERLGQITISALKQCGRLYLPKLSLKPMLKAMSPLSIPSYFGDTREQAPFFLDTLLHTPLSSALFFVGPEKGFHEEEIMLLETKLKSQGVHLHPNILRVDTAAIASLSLLSAFLLKKS